ncbi:MAG: EAL domain-containing protein, partial [Mobilitalea sp.]
MKILNQIFRKHHFEKFIIFILILTAALLLHTNATVTAADVSSRKNILIIHSYNQGFLWTDELHRGIIEKLPSDQYNFYTEYLDAYRINPTDPYKIEIIKEYSKKDISYIVVTDNPAFDLMLSLQEDYFPNIPILFAGVNGGIPNGMNVANVTGILQNVDYEALLLWIADALPNITDILICGADTDTTKGTYAQISSALENINSDKLGFTLHLITIEDYNEQLAIIKSYDSSTTALYTAGSFGVLDHQQYTDMLSSNTDMPTFCGVSTSISGKVIGGFVVSPYVHGSIIGDDLLRLEKGTSIASIPIIDTPVQEIVFNYNGLKEYHISESSLPKNGSILNKPRTIFVLSTYQMLLIIVIFGLLIIIISALLIIIRIRRISNIELNQVNKELSANKLDLEINSAKLMNSQEELSRNYALLIDSNTKIQNLLDYNQLTGIMYDTKFFAVLNEKFEDCSPITILNITITNLDKLTFTHGKNVYESILANIGTFLTQITSGNDLIGLTNNNLFLVATSEFIDEESPLIKQLKSYFEQPLYSDLFTIILKYKIGISYYPTQATSYAQLFHYSNLAITNIIDNSMTNVAIYEESILENINKENLIKTEIEIALLEKEFVLYYQPKYAIDRITILGLEALIRWDHKDGTIKYPGYFINIAEQSGQIINIGFYVIEEACKAILQYNLIEKQIPIAINLSGHHFASMDIVHKLSDAVNKYKIPPRFLEIEITETTLIENKETSSAILKELKNEGFTITLDDFGTGYASFN